MSTRLSALDGWRGVCAMLVVLYHFAPTTSRIGTVPIVVNGFLFVDFFFVLSGFVILHAYGRRLSTAREAATFVWSRLARLWPLHAALLGMLVCLEVTRVTIGTAMGPVAPAFSGHFPLSSLPSQFLFLEGLGLNSALTWNWPAWSVATEFLVAVLLALVGITLPRRHHAWTFLAMAVTALLVVALFSPRHMDTAHDFGVVRCAAGFLGGAFCYLRWAGGSGLRPTEGRGVATVREIVAVGLVIVFVTISGRTAASLLAPVVFGLTVSTFADGRGEMSRALECRGLQALGAWSFSIYMLQTPLAMLVYFPLRLVEKLSRAAIPAGDPAQADPVTGAGAGVAGDCQVVAFLLLLILAARLAHRHIERPAQARLRGLFPTAAV